MLMKLTPGLNFINILRAAFARPDPERAKKTNNLTVYFALLGYACAKAAHRMLMKLTPERYDAQVFILNNQNVVSIFNKFLH